MIKTLIIIIAILLYSWVGLQLFNIGVDAIGGRARYLQEMKRTNPEINVCVAYVTAVFIFAALWPFYLLRGIIRGNKEK